MNKPNAFESAYPGSMFPREDGEYLERHDAPSLAAALLEQIKKYKHHAEDMEEALRQIGDFAHDKSTGPAVPDALWEVRSMAYDALRARGVDLPDEGAKP